eukprot:TRINITY_DN17302_c0_g1_i1.p1 TRINITY_DN17302_c0_g1~~TRINITY_DN17302_c0_g1_i1.p1  ORF type:complete len:1085 (+),score=284.96 TRINITY_DN17302_c0_g1_i1:75-3329(+)
MSSLEEEQQKQIRRRDNIVNELRETELSYRASLEAAEIIFLREIREKSLLSEEEISRVFNNLDEIKDISTRFWKKLEARKRENRPEIGDVILAFLSAEGFTDIYQKYINGVDNALRLIESHSSKKTSNPHTLSTLNYNNLTLCAFLVTPVQRIPRYVLLLRDLLQNTPQDQSDYHDVEASLEKVSKMAWSINESKRVSENHAKLQSYLSTFHEDSRPALLKLLTSTTSTKVTAFVSSLTTMPPYRSLMVEGSCLCSLTLQRRTLILFTDLLICASNSRKKDKERDKPLLQFQWSVNLLFSRIEEQQSEETFVFIQRRAIANDVAISEDCRQKLLAQASSSSSLSATSGQDFEFWRNQFKKAHSQLATSLPTLVTQASISLAIHILQTIFLTEDVKKLESLISPQDSAISSLSALDEIVLGENSSVGLFYMTHGKIRLEKRCKTEGLTHDKTVVLSTLKSGSIINNLLFRKAAQTNSSFVIVFEEKSTLERLPLVDLFALLSEADNLNLAERLYRWVAVDRALQTLLGSLPTTTQGSVAPYSHGFGTTTQTNVTTETVSPPPAPKKGRRLSLTPMFVSGARRRPRSMPPEALVAVTTSLKESSPNKTQTVSSSSPTGVVSPNSTTSPPSSGISSPSGSQTPSGSYFSNLFSRTRRKTSAADLTRSLDEKSGLGSDRNRGVKLSKSTSLIRFGVNRDSSKKNNVLKDSNLNNVKSTSCTSLLPLGGVGVQQPIPMTLGNEQPSLSPLVPLGKAARRSTSSATSLRNPLSFGGGSFFKSRSPKNREKENGGTSQQDISLPPPSPSPMPSSILSSRDRFEPTTLPVKWKRPSLSLFGHISFRECDFELKSKLFGLKLNFQRNHCNLLQVDDLGENCLMVTYNQPRNSSLYQENGVSSDNIENNKEKFEFEFESSTDRRQARRILKERRVVDWSNQYYTPTLSKLEEEKEKEKDDQFKLSQTEWEDLLSHAVVKTYEPSSLIMKQGDTAQKLVFIIKGVCRIQHAPSSSATSSGPSPPNPVRQLVEAGNVIGETSFLVGGISTCSTYANQDYATVAELDRNTLDSVFAQSPRLSLGLHRYLAKVLAARW